VDLDRVFQDFVTLDASYARHRGHGAGSWDCAAPDASHGRPGRRAEPPRRR
jgi:hypothetical protein